MQKHLTFAPKLMESQFSPSDMFKD